MDRSGFDLSDDDKIYWNLAASGAEALKPASQSLAASGAEAGGGSATRAATNTAAPPAAPPLAGASSAAAAQGSGQQYVNLIEFYNTRFIQECKHLLCSPAGAKGMGGGGGGMGGAAGGGGPPPSPRGASNAFSPGGYFRPLASVISCHLQVGSVPQQSLRNSGTSAPRLGIKPL